MYDWITPEKLHVVTNHVPLIGLAVAAVALVIAIPVGKRGALITALSLVLLTSASVAVVMDSGEKAYERYESPALEQYLDQAGDEWMHIHEDRAHLWSKFVYANAIVALLAIGFAAWRPKDAGRYAAGLTLILSLGCVASMAWVADAGGKIHHQHFRPAEQTTAQPDTPQTPEHHDHDDEHEDADEQEAVDDNAPTPTEPDHDSPSTTDAPASDTPAP